MSIPKSEHKVYIYKDDYNDMCTEVYKHQRIETGGNLFGLWTTSGSAVIHVVLGPGQDCRRTDTSFHQDIEYMHRVGRFVNDSYMLCHIGEWHSHHSLSLSKPSHGDEQTIERNFPKGMSKFLVIIANIKNRDTIVLSPYFFTDGGKRYEKAEYVVLETENPFLKNDKILAQIELAAEGKGRQQSTLVEITNHSGDTRDRRNAGSKSQQDGNTSPTRLQANQGTSQVNPSTSNSQVIPSASTSQANPSTPESHVNPSSSNASGDRVEPMDTGNGGPYPPRDYPVNATSASQPSTSAGNQTDPDFNKNGGEGNASVQDIILKEIHDQLKKWFGKQPESVFVFETSKHNPGAVEIRFQHNKDFWMVRFPEDFPTNPAELFCSTYQETLHLSKCSAYIVEPLNNEVNILLSIKNRCSNRRCDVCKHLTKESLYQSNFNPRSMEKLAASVNKVADDITTSLGDVGDLRKNCLSDSHAEITFKHGERYWIIGLPAHFPAVPANVYYLLYEGSSQKHDAFFHGGHSYGPQALNTSELIIKAIHLKCICGKCFDARRQYR